jgi:hypothetical protein
MAKRTSKRTQRKIEHVRDAAKAMRASGEKYVSTSSGLNVYSAMEEALLSALDDARAALVQQGLPAELIDEAFAAQREKLRASLAEARRELREHSFRPHEAN